MSKENKITRHDVRYMFEHRILPQMFFQDKEKFLMAILQAPEILYNILNDMFEQAEMLNPYRKEDFRTKGSSLADGVYCLRIHFPEPEEEPLCLRTFVLFDESVEHCKYFCVEKGNDGSGGYPFLCAWSEAMEHMNFGPCYPDEYREIAACVELYCEEFGLEFPPRGYFDAPLFEPDDEKGSTLKS